MRVISRKVILAAAIASSLGVGVPLQAADVTPPPPTNAVTSSAALPPIASREGPVTVTVTPRNLAPGSTTWEFGVVLDTHSQPLSEDVAKSATLVDAHGGRHAALGWEGAATGGHHREGTLKFEPLAPDTDTVKLENHRSGRRCPPHLRMATQVMPLRAVSCAGFARGRRSQVGSMPLEWLIYCVVAGFALLLVVTTVQGFDVWSALLMALFLACPLMSVLIWREGTRAEREDNVKELVNRRDE